MTPELNDYIVEHSLREAEVLRDLREETQRDPFSVMQITPIQGQFLALLVKMLGAKRSIEIGTYTGYSALWVALAMPPDSFTIACDINSYWGSIAKQFWAKAGVAEKIDFRLGEAEETLKQLIKNGESGTFDFVFIDADKCNYGKYFELSMDLVRNGGMIVVDNTLLYGSVLMNDIVQADLKDTISLTVADVAAIKELNRRLLNDRRIEISMLPVADGLTIIIKRK